MADNEAEQLKSQQMVAKARARTKIYEESEVDNKVLHHNKSLLDLLKIFTEPTLVLAIIKEMSLPLNTRGM